MRRAPGFTLIEVLVALAIVTIGMAAVMSAITSSAQTIIYMRDKTFAQWVGENQIATVRLSGQLAQQGNSDGDSDYAGTKWHWRQEVQATEIPGVMRIDVNVRPADVKGDDDGPWYTTVTGIQGDAVGVPNGYLPDWGAQLLPGQGGYNLGGSSAIGSGTTNFGVQGGGSSLGGTTLGSPSTGNSSSPADTTLGGASDSPPTPPASNPDSSSQPEPQ